MSTSTTPVDPPLTGALYRHVVATTVVQCLVVVVALAVDAMATWAAGLVLGTALAQAAHAAHLRRATHQRQPALTAPQALRAPPRP